MPVFILSFLTEDDIHNFNFTPFAIEMLHMSDHSENAVEFVEH